MPINGVRDANGVLLTTGTRVEMAGREGKVRSVLAPANAFVLWDGARDDELVLASDLITVDAVREVGFKKRYEATEGGDE